MMATFIKDASIIGNYRVATNFAIILAFFTAPISTVLFPAFSKLNPQNERQLLKSVFASSVKYVALLLVPATTAIMVLSAPLVGTLYGDKWLYAAQFLTLYVTINIFAIFGNLSAFSLLYAFGETRMLLKLYSLTLFIGIPVAFLIIPRFGIPGLIFVNILAGLPSMFIAVRWVSNHYGAKSDLRASASILLASVTAGAVCYLALGVFNTFDWVRLAAGLVAFLAVFLPAAPLLGALNQTDIYNLRTMFSGLGIISKLLEIPLSIMEKSLEIRGRHVEISGT
jgi:O-antigen/teichoic acid export membrane protein